MSHRPDPHDPEAFAETFAEDLRSAFPHLDAPERMVEEHLTAMMSAAQLLAEEGASVLEPVSHPSPDGLTTPRRKRMRGRMVRRVIAVAAGLVLSLGGLAIAGAFQGSDVPDDDDQAIVADLPVDDQGDVADDQGEDGDDQGEDGDDQGQDENADDDQGQDENADDDQGGDDQNDADNDQGQDGDGGDSQD